MSTRMILTLLWLIVGAHVSLAGPFADANAAFQSGDFQQAVDGYEKSLQVDGPSAAAYYNLGNAYQRMEKYGFAILAYERARLITPRDPDLRANLEKARKAVSAFDGTGGNSNALLTYFSRNEWSWILVGAAVLIGGLAFAAGCKRIKRRWMIVTAIGVSLLVIGVASMALVIRSGEANRAVVVSKEAVLRLSPFAKAESVATPGEGRMVSLGKREGGYFYVTVLGQGVSGWMATEDVERLIP